MYIGPHTCMSGYVSAYHGVGKLCILLHTILCHAVLSPLVLMTKFDKAMMCVCVCVCTQAKWTGIGRGGLVRL